MNLTHIFDLNGLVKNTRLNKPVLEGANKRDVSLRVQVEGLLIRRDGEKDFKQYDFTVTGELLITEFQRLEGKLIRVPVNAYADERRNVNVSLLPSSYPTELIEVKTEKQSPQIVTNLPNTGVKPPESK